MNKLPKARNKDIVVQNLAKEILVYDLNTNKAYNLNETSAIIYQACDGETLLDEFKAKNNFTDDIIFLVLNDLRQEDLIEKSDDFVSSFNGMNRREVIRKIGLSSMISLPVIASLIAPTAAQAQSGVVNCAGLPGGSACNPPAGGHCCGSTCLPAATPCT
ncbi:MAG: PqqD family protein [Pyrinomonadaceae bacterium]